MTPRTLWLTLVVLALPAAGLARPSDRPPPPAPVARQPAAQATPTHTAAQSLPLASRAVSDRRAIFEILCGGATLQDVGVRQHLWRVAGSLSERSWIPPRVTVRMVVDSSAK